MFEPRSGVSLLRRSNPGHPAGHSFRKRAGSLFLSQRKRRQRRERPRQGKSSRLSYPKTTPDTFPRGHQEVLIKKIYFSVTFVILLAAIILLRQSNQADDSPREIVAELTTEQRQRQQQIITDQQLITHPEKIVGMPAQKFQELLTLADETAAIGEAVNYHFQTPARPNDDGSDGILYISVSAGKIVNAGLYDTLMN